MKQKENYYKIESQIYSKLKYILINFKIRSAVVSSLLLYYYKFFFSVSLSLNSHKYAVLQIFVVSEVL